jgi:general secretion pathway protein D
VIGRLFARTRQETEQTDIVLTLTPHIVRVLDLDEEDLRAFTVRGEAPGTAAFGGVPALPAVQPAAPVVGAPVEADDMPVAIPILPPVPQAPGDDEDDD